MRSIRNNLFLAVWGLLILLVMLCGVISFNRLKALLYSEFDKALLHRLSWAVTLIEAEKGEISFEWEEWQHEAVSGLETVHLWMRSMGDSGEWKSFPPAIILPNDFPQVFENKEWRNFVVDSGECIRMVGMSLVVQRDWDRSSWEEAEISGETGIRSSDPSMVEIWIGRKDMIQSSLSSLLIWMCISGLVAILLGGVGIHYILGRQLKPLGVLAHWIHENRNRQDQETLELNPCPRELYPIVGALNGLIQHNRSVLLREKTLTSNVAHELRNPVAGLMSSLEVLRLRKRSVEEYQETVGECFEIAKRMNWLVNNLLSLARMESGQQKFFPQKIVLEECLQDWWEPFSDRAFEKGVAVQWLIEAKAEMYVDADFLRLVLSNLFDNALSYCPSDSVIQVSGNRLGTLLIKNECSEAFTGSMDRVFDPFWRNDEERGSDGNHVGLGLGLCRKVMEGMGGSIRAWVEDKGRVFVVEIKLTP